MRNSEKIKQTFNGRVQWEIAGGYFKLMSTVSPVTVDLYKNSEIVHKASNVEGGHYQRIEFDRVAITTGGNEAVSWLYAPSEGGTDRVIVAGTLGQLAQQLIGGVNALEVTDRGFAYGASFQASALIASAGTEEVLAPASNTDGVIVWEASILTGHATAGSTTKIALIAKASVPASWADGDNLLSVTCYLATAVGQVSVRALRERAVFVGAGKGLYFLNSGGINEGSAGRSVRYTVLP